jgi:hypothetical protein
MNVGHTPSAQMRLACCVYGQWLLTHFLFCALFYKKEGEVIDELERVPFW